MAAADARDTASARLRGALDGAQCRDRGGVAAPRGRQLRVKYEDLATQPARGVAKLLRFAGLPPTPLKELLRDHEHHLVRGNPMGYRPGVGNIQLDDEWRRTMATAQKWAVTWRTLPLLAAYGYRPWSGFV